MPVVSGNHRDARKDPENHQHAIYFGVRLDVVEEDLRRMIRKGERETLNSTYLRLSTLFGLRHIERAVHMSQRKQRESPRCLELRNLVLLRHLWRGS